MLCVCVTQPFMCAHAVEPFDRMFPLISNFQAAGAFIRMYSGLCTVGLGLVNNGENKTLSGLGLEKRWRAAGFHAGGGGG